MKNKPLKKLTDLLKKYTNKQEMGDKGAQKEIWDILAKKITPK